MAKPVAIGPTSKTVIGSVTADPSAPTPVAAVVAPGKPAAKHDWKRIAIPIGLIGIAVYITMRYKGHV